MTIYFNEIFKSLRKEKDLTQEQMAEILGVSPQAISRWETSSTYPDITLLPIIADFFGISVDDLLGTGKEKNQSRIKEYMTQFQTAISQGSINECIELMRTALIEFPNNHLILSNLMYALYVASEDQTLCTRYAEEIITIGERILSYCTDDPIRLEAKRLLFRHYCDTNRKQKALVIADSLPDENASKESNIYWALDGDARILYLKERIDLYTNHLTWAIWALSTHSDAIDDKIKYLHALQNIENVIYEHKDFGSSFYSKARISATLSKLYLQKDNLDSSIAYANQAVESAINCVLLPKCTVYSSPLLQGLAFNKHDMDTSDSRNLCQEIYEDYFKQSLFDSIRTISAIEILKNHF